MNRRGLLAVLALAAATFANVSSAGQVAVEAGAEIVPYPPGGISDALARHAGRILSNEPEVKSYATLIKALGITSQ